MLGFGPVSSAPIAGEADVRRIVSGTVPIALSPSGALVGAGALVGVLPIEVDFDGAVVAIGGLEGTLPVDLAPAGELLGVGAMLGGLPVALAPEAVLRGRGLLEGEVPIAFEPDGELVAGGSLAGIVPIAIFFEGTEQGRGELAGVLPFEFVLEGLLQALEPRPLAILEYAEPLVELVETAEALVGARTLAEPEIVTIIYLEEGPMDVGDVARLIVEFRYQGELVDPAGVTLQVRPPTGPRFEWTYPGGGVNGLSVGRFEGRFPVTEAGTWRYRWVATGTYAAAKQGSFVAGGGPL